MRRKNLNALERMLREKIGVAGDDVASPAAHRKFEEFVVLGSRQACIRTSTSTH
jgi:hypothetical protein